MPVAVAFIDVRFVQRGDAVFQHALAVRIHQPRLKTFLMVFGRGDDVEAFVVKEIGPAFAAPVVNALGIRSEEHTSELQSLMRISYAVFCLKKNKTHKTDKM